MPDDRPTLPGLALDGESLPCPFHHDHPVIQLTDAQVRMLLADPYVSGLVVVMSRPDGARVVGDALARRILDGSSKHGASMLDRARRQVLDSASGAVVDQIAKALLPEVKAKVETDLDTVVAESVKRAVANEVSSSRIHRLVSDTARTVTSEVVTAKITDGLPGIVEKATAHALAAFKRTMVATMSKAIDTTEVPDAP